MKEININPVALYRGCMHAALAHAIAVGIYPEMDYEHSWDGMNYNMNNGQGCRATITFHSQYIVGVFQDVSAYCGYKDARIFFEGASNDIIDVANAEALQYVLDDVQGETKPLITAAFWGSWKQLFSNQTISELFDLGGDIIEKQLLDYPEASDYWKEYYELNEKQIYLIDVLFQKRMKDKESTIVLEEKEKEILVGNLQECKISLQELNFVTVQNHEQLRLSP